jgi:amino acid permease
MVEVESTLATDRDPRHEMMKGVYTAYIIVAVLYFGVAIAGYLVFGANVKDDILLSIASASSSATISNAVVAAELLVMLHITFAFQVYMMPVFALVEERFPPPKATPSHPDHLAIVRLIGHRILRRWPILAAQWLVASAFPFFGGIIGFVGGLGTTVLTFVLPPIMYLIWVKRGFKSKIFAAVAASWIIVVVYSIVGVSASAGSIWTLATNTTFAFFQ